MRIAVTGSSGLIGSEVVTTLATGGHDVLRLVRRPAAAADEVTWDPDAGTIDRTRLAGVDAVVHLAGEGIGDHRWSDEHKRQVRDSRIRRPTHSRAPSVAGSARQGCGRAGSSL